MENLYFVTDLDRTIIHSKNPGFRCVEFIGDREITYMTDSSYNKLMELLKYDNLKFVPCTMRNLHQTLRVDFIREYNPEIMICSNGAQIYINGELDLEWDKRMKSLVDYENLTGEIYYLNVVAEQYKEIIDVLEIRNIEDFYITVKCASCEDASKFFDVIKDNFGDYTNVIKIYAKIFIMNKSINKIFALRYLEKKFNIKELVTSGDTEVDKDFTSRGISILPRHASFTHKNAFITDNEGIYCTEEILNIVESMMKIKEEL